MIKKTMPSLLIAFSVTAAVLPRLHADTIGISVDGICDAGSCPATPLPFNTSDTLPVDISITLPDGDSYLIFGSFNGTNNSNGTGFSVGHDFEVKYEGNATGGPSAADTVNVEAFDAFQTTVGSVIFDRDLIGSFGPGIAASSSASSCVNGSISCLGPAHPPSSFSLTTSFPLSSTSGAFT
jgi:hypothetical protein